MRRIVLYFFLLGILSACADNKPDKLNVLSTIKPIHNIVSAIAGEHISSAQIIPDFSSPHHYAFKPSDLRKLKNADIIFRIDEHFESMLNGALQNVTLKNTTLQNSKKTNVISLADNPKIKKLRIANPLSHTMHIEKENNKAHTSLDMHFFTSPKNTLIIAKQITAQLIKSDPENKSDYEKNLRLFSQEIQQTSHEIEQKLNTVKNKPYVVFHNSWQYFAHDFGLQKPIIIDNHEAIKAGGKSLANIRQQIKEKNIHCLFTNPNISTARSNTISENLNMKISNIDILQSHYPSTIAWLKAMGATVTNCLE